MRRGWPVLTASMAWLVTTPMCLAQEVSQLRGEAFLAGKTAVDPPPDEPKNSHAYLTVSGPAALRQAEKRGRYPRSARHHLPRLWHAVDG